MWLTVFALMISIISGEARRGTQSPKLSCVHFANHEYGEHNTMERNQKETQLAVETKSVEKSTLGNERRDSHLPVQDVGQGVGQQNKCPHCKGRVKVLDSFADSRTVRCEACLQCALIKSSPLIRTVIPLRSFHLTRGVGSMLRPLHDMVLAEELVECLKHDRWPSKATTVDFGIATPSHLGALQSAYWGGCNVYDLDRVLGDGKAITQLVQAVREQRYRDVRFFTVYDGWALPSSRWNELEEDV